MPDGSAQTPHRSRLLKPRIQNRLLLAFVTVALVPMTAALWAVVKLNEEVVEREILAKLEAASVETGGLIAQAQDEALQVASELTNRPEFDGLYVRKSPVPFEPPIQLSDLPLVALWLPNPAPDAAVASEEPALPEYGVRTLMLTKLNEREVLLAGAVLPVRRNDAVIGQLAVGQPLGKSFAQDIGIQTGVVARIYHEKAPRRMQRILFGPDETTLSSVASEQLRRLVNSLADHPQVTVIVEGHTDDTANARHNYHLSQRRTALVATELERLGIARRRISQRNYGEARPIAANDTPEGRALNRRVDIQLAFEDEEVANIQDLPISAEVRERLFSDREPYYDKAAFLKGEPYRALYRPLVSRNGRVLGMLFLGIPQKYTFTATVATWRFYPLWLTLGLLLALGLGYMVSRSISRPLRRFVAGVRQVADGNIDQRMEVLSRDELGDLASAFNAMTHELRFLRERESEFRRRDRLAALGEMAAGIAHEIRNPLNIMRNAAHRLERRVPEDESELREMSGFIKDEVDRLNRVVTQFLTFARHPLPDPQPIDVNALILRVAEAIAPEAREAKVAVRTQLDSGLPATMLDPHQGYQVLLNLCQNALQQMGPQGGGKLTLATRAILPAEETADTVGFTVIEVSDTGPGIPPENLDRVFNPFFTTREDGVGLGLSLVHNIVTAHNGTITVTSSVGTGATFVLSLPAIATAEVSVASDTVPTPPREADAVRALQTTP